MKPRVNLLLNASAPFAIRSRCKHCGKNKFEFFRDYNNPPWIHNLRRKRDNERSNDVLNWVSDTNSDYIRQVLPEFETSSYYGHSIGYNKYNPKRFRTISDTNGRYSIDPGFWIVVCGNCHKQVWAVATDNKKRLPENANRKARIRLPHQATPSPKWW